MTNSALSEERELKRLIFFKFYLKFIVASQTQFRGSFYSDKQSKWRDSVNYKFIFLKNTLIVYNYK